jgi:hypothetical protein
MLDRMSGGMSHIAISWSDSSPVYVYVAYASWVETGDKMRVRGFITSKEARSWRDPKAQNLMVLSREALARRAPSDESANPKMNSMCPSKGAPTGSRVEASNS